MPNEIGPTVLAGGSCDGQFSEHWICGVDWSAEDLSWLVIYLMLGIFANLSREMSELPHPWKLEI